jgi:hypothetical protein
MRLIASLDRYVATVSGDALYLHLLAQAQVTAPVAGGVLSLAVTTDYPWDGSVGLTVVSAPAGECGIAMRVPGWCAGSSVRLNGAPVAADRGEDGYLLLRRAWRPGDVIACSLDMPARLTYPHRRVDALRGTVAVERGPLVYCFEQADQPAGTSVEDIALGTGSPAVRALTVSGVGRTVLIDAPATHLPASTRNGLLYLPVSSGTGQQRTGLQGTGSHDTGSHDTGSHDTGSHDTGSHDTGSHSTARAGSPATAVAIPYFQWDNRDGQAMRVWLPCDRPGNRATAQDPDPSRAPLPAHDS